MLHVRSKKTGFLLLGVLVVLAVSQFHYITEAQVASQSLEVSPPTQEVSVDPGKTITVKAKLRNNTPKSLPITAKIEDFTAQGEEGQVALSSNSKWSVSQWTKITPSTFSLAGGEEQEVTATITIPKDAAGGRYGSFVFGVDTEKAPNSASVSQQIASLFLLRISGKVDEVVRLDSFSAPRFQEFGPVPFSLSFANTGNVHVKPFGLISVTDMFGRKTADIVVKGSNIFPEATRVITASLHNKFLIGQYHATAVMYYGESNQSLVGTTSFVVFPVRIVAGIIILLVLFFILRKRLGRAFKALTR
jgi:hypothetical protein